MRAKGTHGTSCKLCTPMGQHCQKCAKRTKCGGALAAHKSAPLQGHIGTNSQWGCTLCAGNSNQQLCAPLGCAWLHGWGPSQVGGTMWGHMWGLAAKHLKTFVNRCQCPPIQCSRRARPNNNHTDGAHWRPPSWFAAHPCNHAHPRGAQSCWLLLLEQRVH